MTKTIGFVLPVSVCVECMGPIMCLCLTSSFYHQLHYPKVMPSCFEKNGTSREGWLVSIAGHEPDLEPHSDFKMSRPNQNDRMNFLNLSRIHIVSSPI